MFLGWIFENHQEIRDSRVLRDARGSCRKWPPQTLLPRALNGTWGLRHSWFSWEVSWWHWIRGNRFCGADWGHCGVQVIQSSVPLNKTLCKHICLQEMNIYWISRLIKFHIGLNFVITGLTKYYCIKSICAFGF